MGHGQQMCVAPGLRRMLNTGKHYRPLSTTHALSYFRNSRDEESVLVRTNSCSVRDSNIGGGVIQESFTLWTRCVTQVIVVYSEETDGNM